MIDPFDITNYNYSNDELEEFVIFAMAVAGKTASTICVKVDEFLRLERSGSPFEKLRKMIRKGTLRSNMEKVKLGKYALLERGFKQLVEDDLDVKTCSLEELEAIPGISHKTSRFFVLHTREDCGDIACIDTHIRRWLNELGYSGNYFELERAFISEAKKRGRTLADLDLEIWKQYARD
tara:strand:+ start:3985 stop:4521 length:537 start_codon:yes stop_codon:yes gene_type:complete